jgi:predicted transcriptional regulator
MLEPILGSTNRERVLVYLKARGEGYAREIARFFDTDLSPVQDQLEKLEAGGVIVSKEAGRTVMYRFNPRYPFLPALQSLLEKALEFYPEQTRTRLLMDRRRPRRRGKPE